MVSKVEVHATALSSMYRTDHSFTVSSCTAPTVTLEKNNDAAAIVNLSADDKKMFYIANDKINVDVTRGLDFHSDAVKKAYDTPFTLYIYFKPQHGVAAFREVLITINDPCKDEE